LVRVFENSPAIHGRGIVRQNQLSPAGTKELPRGPVTQGGKKSLKSENRHLHFEEEDFRNQQCCPSFFLNSVPAFQ
jgi:hypothetical protein